MLEDAEKAEKDAIAASIKAAEDIAAAEHAVNVADLESKQAAARAKA